MSKAIVVGMLERGGLVKLTHVNKAGRDTQQGIIKREVPKGANLYTDAHKGYTGLSREYVHGVGESCDSEGFVHSNGLENF